MLEHHLKREKGQYAYRTRTLCSQYAHIKLTIYAHNTIGENRSQCAHNTLTVCSQNAHSTLTILPGMWV